MAEFNRRTMCSRQEAVWLAVFAQLMCKVGPSRAAAADVAAQADRIAALVPLTTLPDGMRSEEIDRVARMIDDERWDDARKALAELAADLGPNDPDVVRLGSMLDFMRGDDAPVPRNM